MFSEDALKLFLDLMQSGMSYEDETKSSAALTPEGNMTLVDDIGEEEDKSSQQFITLVTKAGNTFYLIIDRDKDGNQNVHFLNMVDEADLLALMDEEEAAKYREKEPEVTEPAETEKPQETEPAPEEQKTESEQKKSSPLPMIMLLLFVIGAAGVGGYLYIKMKGVKPASKKNQPDPDADYTQALYEKKLVTYPSAKLLVASKKDFETARRKKFCARIATGDYDAVIIGHSQFEKIPVSAERQERILTAQIDEIENAIAEMKSQNGERFSIKQMEKTRKGLEARLEKLRATDRKDDVITFEQLGVDRLFVDEAHAFKNRTKRCFIFRAAHAAGLLCGRLKDRQAHLLTDHVIAPHQLLQLFLCHVQLFAGFKVDGVDDAVGVDVLPVYMGADQHLAAVEVFCQPPRGFVGLPRIDSRAFWKALHHVIEHHAAVLVVEQLGVQEIIVDALWLAVDAADERRALPCGFHLLHDVEHHAAHGGVGLCAPFVVHKMYDGHTAHRPSMTARRAALTSDSSPAAFSRPMTCTLPMLARTVRRLMLLPMPLSWRSSSFCSSITTIRLPRQQAVT